MHIGKLPPPTLFAATELGRTPICENEPLYIDDKAAALSDYELCGLQCLERLSEDGIVIVCEPNLLPQEKAPAVLERLTAVAHSGQPTKPRGRSGASELKTAVFPDVILTPN